MADLTLLTNGQLAAETNGGEVTISIVGAYQQLDSVGSVTIANPDGEPVTATAADVHRAVDDAVKKAR